MAVSNNIAEDLERLRKCLIDAFHIAERLGINLGGDISKLNDQQDKTAEAKPETRKSKVDYYKMTIATGKRPTKAEILKRVQ